MNDNQPAEPRRPVGPPAILVLGECLVDLAPAAAPTAGAVAGPARERHFTALPGGGPANVAVGLSRLGVPTTFAGRLSQAGFGPWLRQHLTTNGVDLRYSVDARQAATLAVVTLDSRGRASYTFYGPETADWQWSDDELPAHLGTERGQPGGVRAVHTGTLVAAFEPGASVLARWLARLRHAGDVLISFDPNVRLGLVDDLDGYRQKLEGMISSAHIVKASNEDIDAIHPGARPLEVAGQWLAAGASLVVVTEGEHGAVALHRNGATVRCAPPPVHVVDTIGAGDAFGSGLLAYLADEELLTPAGLAGMSELQLQAAVAQAVAVSALTCTRAGSDPPRREELTAWLLTQ